MNNNHIVTFRPTSSKVRSVLAVLVLSRWLGPPSHNRSLPEYRNRSNQFSVGALSNGAQPCARK